MYDPKVGRFLSEDPIGFEAGDSNLNRYVENEVTIYTDPDGLTRYRVGGQGPFGPFIHSQLWIEDPDNPGKFIMVHLAPPTAGPAFSDFPANGMMFCWGAHKLQAAINALGMGASHLGPGVAYVPVEFSNEDKMDVWKGQIIIYDSTPEQDRKLIDYLKDKYGGPDPYEVFYHAHGIGGDSCHTWAKRHAGMFLDNPQPRPLIPRPKPMDHGQKICCFAAGTQVHTAHGTKLIEAVCAGDEVLSWDLQLKTWSSGRVTSLDIHEGTFDMVSLASAHADIPLQVTTNHDFLTMGGWVPSHILSECNYLRAFRDDKMQWTVVGEYKQANPVYNIRTEAGNYVVGESGLIATGVVPEDSVTLVHHMHLPV